jgi:hypothetical protein
MSQGVFFNNQHHFAGAYNYTFLPVRQAGIIEY